MAFDPLRRIARRLGVQPWLMSLAPQIIWIDSRIRRSTNDRVSLVGLAGLPSIQVTVPGRKTGTPRTTSLLYVPDEDGSLLITGSNWGRTEHPLWTVNVMHADTARVRLGRETFDASIELVEGVDRKAAWDTIVEFWPGYEMEYERSGRREFRIIRLRRRR